MYVIVFVFFMSVPTCNCKELVDTKIHAKDLYESLHILAMHAASHSIPLLSKTITWHNHAHAATLTMCHR